MLKDILFLKCPICRIGTVFRGPYSMNETCPHCGERFERENGYFMGALWIAYGLGVISVIPTIVLMVRVYEAEMIGVVGVATLQLLLLQPLIYLYSRMIWMYVDRSGGRKGWH